MKAGKLVGECIEHYLSLYGAERNALAKAEYLAHQITPLAEAVVIYQRNAKKIAKNARKLNQAETLGKSRRPRKAKNITLARIESIEQAVAVLGKMQQFGQPINYHSNGHRPGR